MSQLLTFISFGRLHHIRQDPQCNRVRIAAHPLQHLFMNEVGAQCGICTPGMIMAAITLGPKPTLDEVKTALAGNLCRCTGYSAIYRAVMKWKGMPLPGAIEIAAAK